MTAPQAAIQSAQSEIRRVGEASPSGGPAQTQRRSGAGPADELAFLALLSSNLGLTPAPTPAAAIGRDHEAAATGKSGLGAAVARQPGAPGRAGASTEALTRSQADMLRTVGRGVSLSALAQAQLQGRASGSYVRASDHASQTLRGDGGTGGESDAITRPREPAHAESQSPARSAAQPQPAASPSRDATGNAASNTQSPPTNASAATPSTQPHDAARNAGSDAGPPTPNGNRAPAPPASTTAPAAGAGTAAPAPTSAASGTPTQSAPASTPAVAPAASARAGTTAAPSKLAPPKPPAADRQGVITQANRALGLALRAKDGSVRFNLAPEHLGALRVELTRTEQGGVSARFEATSQQAREILESSIEQLRASLEARGLRVDRLDVRVAEAAGPQRGGAPTPRPDGSEHPDTGQSAEHESEPDAERGRDDGRDHQPGSGAWPDGRSDRAPSRGSDEGASAQERWSRDRQVGGAEPPSGDRTRVAGMVPGYAPWSDADGVALVEIVA
ncbi:MAG: flagellar hook-length control protein FliK [Phycisphaerales bacterium]